MGSSSKITLHSVFLILVPAIVFCKVIPDEVEHIRDARAFDSLVGGGLGRDLSHTIRKLPLSQRSRMDTLTGFGLGRSFDSDYVLYQYPPWMSLRPYPATEVSKRGFDQIDSAGFGSFSKRSFDQIDSAGFGSFSKRNFDKMDRPGLNDFIGKRDMGKRNFDLIDRPGFGTFSRRR